MPSSSRPRPGATRGRGGAAARAAGAGPSASQARPDQERGRAVAIGTGRHGRAALVRLPLAARPAVGLLPVATGVLAGMAAVSSASASARHHPGLRHRADRRSDRLRHLLPVPGPRADGARRRRHRLPRQRWLRVIWPTVRLGLLTSLIGFASLSSPAFPAWRSSVCSRLPACRRGVVGALVFRCSRPRAHRRGLREQLAA